MEGMNDEHSQRKVTAIAAKTKDEWMKMTFEDFLDSPHKREMFMSLLLAAEYVYERAVRHGALEQIDKNCDVLEDTHAMHALSSVIWFSGKSVGSGVHGTSMYRVPMDNSSSATFPGNYTLFHEGVQV